MLGLFSTLNLGARAMSAQQTAVEVTGQNLANVNNPAYARQRVNFQTGVAVPSPVGPQGTGVEVASIQQMRDTMLDGQVNAEGSVSSYWTTQQGALTNTQTQLGEFLGTTVDGTSGTSASGTSLSVQLDSLFSAFQSVAANPSSTTQRQALVNQAQTLAISFNQASQRLDSVNTDLNQSITNDVKSANQLLSDIAKLNGEISLAESGGSGKANDLRDLRQQKLEGLSKLVNFDTAEAVDGSVSVIVNGSDYFVNGTQVPDQFVASDPGDGQLVLAHLSSGLPVPMTGGSIQGAMDVRDGALQDMRTNLDTLASTLVSQVNTIYNPTNAVGGDFFTGTDAATIAVTASLQSDPSTFTAGAAGASGDNSIARALGQLGTTTQAALNNQTFTSAYAGIVADLGNALSGANDQVNSNTAVTNMLLRQRDSVSGVSLDEEMTNLITFQKAYMASARIITTVDQMLDTVVNLKT